MRIAVCLKHVPDVTTVEVDPFTGAIDKSRLLFVTNPADAVALELALQLCGSPGRVLGLTVGPSPTEAVLRAALAVGATRVLRLWDEQLDATAPPLTARLIAAALRVEGMPNMVLCGTRSSDMGSGQVPALLGEFLGWPVITDVTQIEVEPHQARVQRRLDRGAREVLEVSLPAVLAVEPGLARLRHASFPGLMRAQRAAIPTRGLNELGLNIDELAFALPVHQAFTPPRPRSRPIFTPDTSRPPHERIAAIVQAGVTRKSGKVLEGPPQPMAEAIVDFLREQGFV